MSLSFGKYWGVSPASLYRQRYIIYVGLCHPFDTCGAIMLRVTFCFAKKQKSRDEYTGMVVPVWSPRQSGSWSSLQRMPLGSQSAVDIITWTVLNGICDKIRIIPHDRALTFRTVCWYTALCVIYIDPFFSANRASDHSSWILGFRLIHGNSLS